tara:strand:- start:446 stop:844 length:399 start_codon:yes stop_codon:yes gene_type:complete
MPSTYLNKNLAFSESTYNPEDLLSEWISVSSILLTTSLLFYHMSRVESLKVNPYLAKIVSIGLIFISTVYLIYAMYPYNKRMNFTISECKRLKDCTSDQVEEILLLKRSYLSMGISTILLQFIIVFIVVTTI